MHEGRLLRLREDDTGRRVVNTEAPRMNGLRIGSCLQRRGSPEHALVAVSVRDIMKPSVIECARRFNAESALNTLDVSLFAFVAKAR